MDCSSSCVLSNTLFQAASFIAFFQVIPDFVPGCRRLTPGPGYLEALCENNVGSFISSSTGML